MLTHWWGSESHDKTAALSQLEAVNSVRYTEFEIPYSRVNGAVLRCFTFAKCICLRVFDWYLHPSLLYTMDYYAWWLSLAGWNGIIACSDWALMFQSMLLFNKYDNMVFRMSLINWCWSRTLSTLTFCWNRAQLVSFASEVLLAGKSDSFKFSNTTTFFSLDSISSDLIWFALDFLQLHEENEIAPNSPQFFLTWIFSSFSRQFSRNLWVSLDAFRYYNFTS